MDDAEAVPDLALAQASGPVVGDRVQGQGAGGMVLALVRGVALALDAADMELDTLASDRRGLDSKVAPDKQG